MSDKYEKSTSILKALTKYGIIGGNYNKDIYNKISNAVSDTYNKVKTVTEGYYNDNKDDIQNSINSTKDYIKNLSSNVINKTKEITVNTYNVVKNAGELNANYLMNAVDNSVNKIVKTTSDVKDTAEKVGNLTINDFKKDQATKDLENQVKHEIASSVKVVKNINGGIYAVPYEETSLYDNIKQAGQDVYDYIKVKTEGTKNTLTQEEKDNIRNAVKHTLNETDFYYDTVIPFLNTYFEPNVIKKSVKEVFSDAYNILKDTGKNVYDDISQAYSYFLTNKDISNAGTILDQNILDVYNLSGDLLSDANTILSEKASHSYLNKIENNFNNYGNFVNYLNSVSHGATGYFSTDDYYKEVALYSGLKLGTNAYDLLTGISPYTINNIDTDNISSSLKLSLGTEDLKAINNVLSNVSSDLGNKASDLITSINYKKIYNDCITTLNNIKNGIYDSYIDATKVQENIGSQLYDTINSISSTPINTTSVLTDTFLKYNSSLEDIIDYTTSLISSTDDNSKDIVLNDPNLSILYKNPNFDNTLNDILTLSKERQKQYTDNINKLLNENTKANEILNNPLSSEEEKINARNLINSNTAKIQNNNELINEETKKQNNINESKKVIKELQKKDSTKKNFVPDPEFEKEKTKNVTKEETKKVQSLKEIQEENNKLDETIRFDSPYYERYYCGADVQIWINNKWFDNIASFQYAITNNKSPVYGYFSENFDAVARGTRLVQGQIGVALTDVQEFNKLLSDNLSKIDQNAYRTINEYDKYVDIGFKINIYLGDSLPEHGNITKHRSGTSLKIADCHITNCALYCDTSENPIMMIYNFFARDYNPSGSDVIKYDPYEITMYSEQQENNVNN